MHKRERKDDYNKKIQTMKHNKICRFWLFVTNNGFLCTLSRHVFVDTFIKKLIINVEENK